MRHATLAASTSLQETSAAVSAHRPEANRPGKTQFIGPPTCCNDANCWPAAVIGRRLVTKPHRFLVPSIMLTRLFLLYAFLPLLVVRRSPVVCTAKQYYPDGNLHVGRISNRPPRVLTCFLFLFRSFSLYTFFVLFFYFVSLSVESHSLLPLASLHLNYIHSVLSFSVRCTKNKTNSPLIDYHDAWLRIHFLGPFGCPAGCSRK